MADQTKYQFLKGHLNKNAKNPYQDPTFLTFTLMFDVTSPLFNKDVAVKSLREQYGEDRRADKLSAFIDTMLLINQEMPWYFNSITGVDRALDFDMTKPYWGGDDAKLEIECNETINLPISGLMDLYREAVYNLKGWTQVLPENYKRFNMYVIVSEVRNIQTSIGNTNINTNITADFKPHFMFKFGACKFDITSGKEVLENLNSAAPENPKPKIRIKYETIEKISAQYLNGMLGETIDDNPGVGLEVPGNTTYASRAGQAVNDALNTAMGGLNNLNPIQNITRPNNVYGSVFDVAFERAVNQLDNFAGGVSRIPENIFKNNVTAAKAETNNILKNARENIFGVRSGTTLGTALRAGSINSILPTINNISSQRQNLGNVNE